MAQNTKAAIIIGDNRFYDVENMIDCDLYYYPPDITEWELAYEAKQLLEFYAELVWPIWWPPHIRLGKIKADIKCK